jgi:hypothetical protein
MNPSAGIYVHHVYKYCLRDRTEEMISEAISWSDPFTVIPSDDADPPFTAVQLLSSYTINVRDSQLEMAGRRLDYTDLLEQV